MERALQIGFVDDFAFDIATPSTGAKRVPVVNGVVNRNAGEAYSGGTVDSTFGIVERTVNDVAMTVLPNAPIDAATGLPVPTIAVATDGGVSVIKDDGTVVDSSSTSIYHSVMFNGSDLYAEDTTYADDTQYYGDAGSLSDSFPTFRNFYSYGPTYERLSSSTLSKFSGNILTKLGTPRSFAVGLLADSSTDTSWTALNMVADHSGQNAFAARTALVSYINTSFNTGWMNGDIKLATLSDTDDTDVTGTELVTNGTFDSDTSGWSASGNATFVASGGLGVLNMTSTNGAVISNFSLTLTAGKTYTYTLDWDASSTHGSLYVQFLNSVGATVYQVYFDPTNRGKTCTVSFTPLSSGTYHLGFMGYFWGGSAGGQAIVVDNISARLAEEDRSVNGNGLQVFGTVYKNPVATGADLVAYSGFGGVTPTKYLKQPVGPNLTTGTLALVWYKASVLGSTYGFMGQGSNVNAGYGFGTNSSTGLLNCRITASSGTINAYSSSAVADGTWKCIAVTYDGSAIKIYINCELNTTNTGISGDITSSNDFYVGAGITSVGFRGGSGVALSLARVSATVLSAEQIAKIYEDEKVLFQEGAQATLYGSSDAVTALAYDDTTELLHVGTSAGRSVFQGLRRVDNTTDAVGAAISASNGLVAED